jgi:exonuclease SbcC
MRPLYLEMQAFGPYPDVEKVEFSRLACQSLFLIHGPTGSGKTTIFDAICYALYGKTSGPRSGEQMRCQYAAEDVPTQVTFDFSLGKKRYRIVRLPTQERPKKRGTGTTTMEHKAELWDRTGAAATEEGSLVAGKPKDVEERIEEIMGFEVEQFRQVVLLPQGQFRELLLATSQDREKILETLFGTWVYARIQQLLKERVAEITDECKSGLSRRGALLDAAGTDTEEELAKRIKAGLAVLKQLEGKVSASQKAYESAQEALAKAEDVDRLFKEREEAMAESRSLGRLRQDMKRKGEDLKWAHKAAGLVDIYESCQEKQTARAEAETELGGMEEELGKAKADEKEARSQETAAAALEPEVAEVSDEMSALKTMKPKVESLKSLTGRLRELRKTIARAHADVDTAEARRQRMEQEMAATEADLERLQPLANSMGTLDVMLGDANRMVDDKKKHLAATEHLTSVLNELKQTARHGEEAADRLDRAEADLKQAESAWLSSSAHNLAKQLTPGRPCPVCGSKEHPDPARKTEFHISEAELAERRAAHKEADQALEEVHKEETRLKFQADALKAQVDDLAARLGPNVSKSQPQLEEAYDELLRRHKEAVDAREQIGKGGSGLQQLKEGLAAASEDLRAQHEAVRKQEREADNLESTIKERVAGVPEDLRQLEALERRLKQAQERLAGLKDRQREAAMQARRAERRLAESISKVDAAGKAATRARKAEQKAMAAFARRLKSAGFKTVDDFKDAILKEHDMAELEAAIGHYEERVVLSRERVRRARAKTSGVRRPRLETIAKRLAAKRKAFDTVHGEYAAAEQDLKALRKSLAEIRRISRTLARKEGELQVVGKLSEVANGKNEQRITFQRFVLSSLLDDVTRMANERLRRMSEGRYTLHRAEVLTDLRFSGGLDLEVFDSFSGEQRSVKTLSGGEMFLASLCMALGLADVVQSYTGGIRLDSVFIDEGFGTLDSETLDHAIETLVALQKGGRMVGLISHVPELRERIDVRLDVRPGRHGSSIHLVGV